MKVFFYDTHSFERDHFCELNKNYHHELTFYEGKLNEKSAAAAAGFECVCPFVNDKLDRNALLILSKNGTKLIALRSAGFNHVDLIAAKELGLKIVRVPEYSPYSVAEHAVALILTLNRKIHKAYNRVREGNFSLEGLVGFDLHGKTVGVIGTGKIGRAFIRIARGFGCNVFAYDIYPQSQLALDLNFTHVSLDKIFSDSDIISLHIPLSKETQHLINSDALEKMKKGVMLINTSRGGLIDTKALISGLKSGKLGSAGLDVYEEEQQFFFQDLSSHILNDDVLIRLMTFPNVVLTSHQGFLTKEALDNIADTTLQNITDFQNGKTLINEVL
jgi:D-lactate dehydrogenase